MCSLEVNSLNFVYLVYLASLFEQYLSSGRLPALGFFFIPGVAPSGHGEITCFFPRLYRTDLAHQGADIRLTVKVVMHPMNSHG